MIPPINPKDNITPPQTNPLTSSNSSEGKSLWVQLGSLLRKIFSLNLSKSATLNHRFTNISSEAKKSSILTKITDFFRSLFKCTSNPQHSRAVPLAPKIPADSPELNLNAASNLNEELIGDGAAREEPTRRIDDETGQIEEFFMASEDALNADSQDPIETSVTEENDEDGDVFLDCEGPNIQFLQRSEKTKSNVLENPSVGDEDGDVFSDSFEGLNEASETDTGPVLLEEPVSNTQKNIKQDNPSNTPLNIDPSSIEPPNIKTPEDQMYKDINLKIIATQNPLHIAGSINILECFQIITNGRNITDWEDVGTKVSNTHEFNLTFEKQVKGTGSFLV